ncbi:MAG TPA: hypothetical protein PKV93_11630, partial [Fervidobacterium sp.]|nr:hypothetical protein [Fervidobacterium sp.]
MYSKEDQDRDWELVRQLLCEVYDIPPSFTKGVDHMRQLWMRKSWAFPFLDSNGRLIRSTNQQLSRKQLLECSPKFVELGRTLIAEERRTIKVGYADIFEYDGGMSVIKYLLRLLDSTFNVEDILSNKLSQDLHVGETKVAKGTRLTKALRELVLRDDYEWACGRFIGYPVEKKKEIAEFVILFYSQIVSMIKRTSSDYVVVSFNPLDMLMCSWVTASWRSCHHFIDGQYRFAPFSFLLDDRTGIAYAYRELTKASYKRVSYLKGHSFPKKLWRQMVFFDVKNGSAVFSREYPQEMSHFACTARTIGAGLLDSVRGTESREWNVIKHRDIVTLPNEIVVGSSIDIQHGRWHYEDNPSATIFVEAPFVGFVGMSKVPCPCCGKEYSSSRYLPEGFCASCHEELFSCELCGNRYLVSEGAQRYDVCPSCWDKYSAQCAHCKKSILAVEGFSVEFRDEFYCEECAAELFSTCRRCRERNFRNELVRVSEPGYHAYYCEYCAQECVVQCAHCKTNIRASRACELGG